MGFAMRFENGQGRPEIVCDTCTEPIDDLGTTLVAFPWPDSDGIVMAHVYHKGACDPGHGRDVPANVSSQLWEEMDYFLPWLLWNHGWGEKKTDIADEDWFGETVIRVRRPIDI